MRGGAAESDTGRPLGHHLAGPLGVIAVKAVVSGWVLASGFHAISDDDFARIVIAQQFSASPALDPSRTSWLPFPFWLYGLAFMGLGPSLLVARALAVLLGLCSTLLVYLAARWAGLSRWGAWLGASAAAALPYSAWLGVATVPDAWTHSLCLLAVASCSSRNWKRRHLGAMALLAATLSRYEAWPVAAVFAVFTLYDAWAVRSPVLLVALLPSLAGPMAWVLHGVYNQGDPLFFVGRVAAYQQALGAASPVAESLGRLPIALVRHAPEILAVCGALVSWVALRRELSYLRRYQRWLLFGLALLGFLSVGAAGGSTATHHAERALLLLWLGIAVVSAHLFARLWAWPSVKARAGLVLTVVSSVALGAFVLRPRWGQREAFADRRSEVLLGSLARRLSSPGDRLLVDTTDYGFFAVQAAFGDPARARPVTDHDPRRPAAADPFVSRAALSERIASEGTTMILVTKQHLPVARLVGEPLREDGQLALLQVTSKQSSRAVPSGVSGRRPHQASPGRRQGASRAPRPPARSRADARRR